MRTKLTTHFLLLFLLVSSISFANLKITNDQDPEKDKVLISVLNYMLTRGHYIEKELNDDFSELSSQYEVNDEVYGGIEDQSEMIEAGQAEEPGRGEEGGTTSVNIWVRGIFI